MAGNVVIDQIQIGNNGTSANNFVLKTLNDGSMKLQRGVIGGSLTDVASVDANGNLVAVMPQLLVRDEKPINTSGGTGSIGANTRTLNTIVANTINGASLSSNQITLPAGTYRVWAHSPTGSNLVHRAYLYNVTDAQVQVLGTSRDGITGGNDYASLKGRFTIASTKVFELRHWLTDAASLGVATNLVGAEVYSEIEFIKES